MFCAIITGSVDFTGLVIVALERCVFHSPGAQPSIDWHRRRVILPVSHQPRPGICFAPPEEVSWNAGDLEIGEGKRGANMV